MPGLNSTGPEGKGPRTGRGLGRCKPNDQENNFSHANENEPRALGKGLGRRLGKGIGAGRGLGRRSGRGNQ
jgi:hypothetical protein